MHNQFYSDLIFSIFISTYLVGFSISSIIFFYLGLIKKREIEYWKISFSLGLMNFFSVFLLYYKPFAGQHPFDPFIVSIQILAGVGPFLSIWIFYFTGRTRSISSYYEGEAKTKAEITLFSVVNVVFQHFILISMVILAKRIVEFKFA